MATLKFVLALAALIFLPAWTVNYWQGWLLWANISAWSAALTWHLLRRDPALLERRMAGPGAETEPAQKRIQSFTTVFVLAIFIVAALDRRFGWSVVPVGAVLFGDVLVALGFAIVWLVFQENSFASSTIQVAADQPGHIDRAIRMGASSHVCGGNISLPRRAAGSRIAVGIAAGPAADGGPRRTIAA